MRMYTRVHHERGEWHLLVKCIYFVCVEGARNIHGEREREGEFLSRLCNESSNNPSFILIAPRGIYARNTNISRRESNPARA